MKHPDYYPQNVCHECGMKASGLEVMHNIWAIWHLCSCDVCREEKVCTKPENFGTPKFEGYKP